MFLLHSLGIINLNKYHNIKQWYLCNQNALRIKKRKTILKFHNLRAWAVNWEVEWFEVYCFWWFLSTVPYIKISVSPWIVCYVQWMLYIFGIQFLISVKPNQYHIIRSMTSHMILSVWTKKMNSYFKLIIEVHQYQWTNSEEKV